MTIHPYGLPPTFSEKYPIGFRKGRQKPNVATTFFEKAPILIYRVDINFSLPHLACPRNLSETARVGELKLTPTVRDF